MRHIRLVFLVILILVVQVTAADSLRLFGTRPDFVFLLAAFLALNAPIRMSLPAAWGIGMGRDLLSVSPLGSSALLYMVAAILLAAAREIFVRENPFVQVILVFTAAGAVSGTAPSKPARSPCAA
jgi:rod shape-determining protein MreD